MSSLLRNERLQLDARKGRRVPSDVKGKDSHDGMHRGVIPADTAGAWRERGENRCKQGVSPQDRKTRTDALLLLSLAHLSERCIASLDSPSDFVSQKHVLAVCSPAPFFCMMMHVTTYLKGLFAAWSSFRTASTIDEVQSPTFLGA
jgi:hypothetical protein